MNEEKIEEEEEEEEEKEQINNSSNVFSVNKTQEIISYVRKKVMFHFADRNPQHMWEYLGSLIGMINAYQPHIKIEVDKLMRHPDTDLKKIRIKLSKDAQWDWWQLLERSGYEMDLHGYYKQRGIGEDIIIKEAPMIYDYNVVFGFCDMLFKKGNINVVIGSMDSGKSNYMLGLGLNSIQLGYYILTTNLGIQEGYDHPWVNTCTWMTELLRNVSLNKIQNNKYKKNGQPLKSMYINCILDEGESIMLATSRSDDKQASMFTKFFNFCRKLDMSLSFIYHDYENFPKSLRKSSNISSVIYKGFDEEGKDLKEPQQEAIIDFPSRKYSIHIAGIPKCDLLETDEWSSFDIIDDNNPDKSVDMNEIFSITKGKRAHEVPHAILRYLDTLSFENQPYENVLEMVRKIEKKIRESYIGNIEKPKEYETIIRREFELSYKISDASKIRLSEKAIKKIAQEEYDIYKVEKKKGEVDPETIDYKKCDFDKLFSFITKNRPAKIKRIVGEDYRQIDNNEIRKLLENRISRNLISYVYSYRVRNIDLFKDYETTLLNE